MSFDAATLVVALGGFNVAVSVGVFFRLGGVVEAITELKRRVGALEGVKDARTDQAH